MLSFLLLRPPPLLTPLTAWTVTLSVRASRTLRWCLFQESKFVTTHFFQRVFQTGGGSMVLYGRPPHPCPHYCICLLHPCKLVVGLHLMIEVPPTSSSTHTTNRRAGWDQESQCHSERTVELLPPALASFLPIENAVVAASEPVACWLTVSYCE
jgi:hypothetical protein